MSIKNRESRNISFMFSLIFHISKINVQGILNIFIKFCITKYEITQKLHTTVSMIHETIS